MDINSKVDHMDEELQLLKNEIKQVLLEVQEHVLNVQNPFAGASSFAVSAPPPPPAPAPAPTPAAEPETPAVAEVPSIPVPEDVVLDMGAGAGSGAPGTVVLGGGGPVEGGMPSGGGGGFNDGYAEQVYDDGPERDDVQEKDKPAVRSSEDREKKAKKAPRVRASVKAKMASDKGSRLDDESYDRDDWDEFDDMDEPMRGPSAGGEVLDDVDFSDEDGLRGSKKNLDSMDLVTFTGLLQWTSSNLRKVGKDHLSSLLELAERSGRLSPHTRQVLEAVVPLLEVSAELNQPLSVKQVVSMVAQLDGFLGNVSNKDSRMLPFLLQDELEVFPLIRP